MFIWTPNPYNLLPYCQVSLNTRVCSLDVFQCLVSCQFDIAFIVVLSWQSSQEAALFLCSGESTGFWFHDIAVVRPWPLWPLSLASALDEVVVHKLEEWDGAAREPLGAVPGQLRGRVSKVGSDMSGSEEALPDPSPGLRNTSWTWRRSPPWRSWRSAGRSLRPPADPRHAAASNSPEHLILFAVQIFFYI